MVNVKLTTMFRHKAAFLANIFTMLLPLPLSSRFNFSMRSSGPIATPTLRSILAFAFFHLLAFAASYTKALNCWHTDPITAKGGRNNTLPPRLALA